MKNVFITALLLAAPIAAWANATPIPEPGTLGLIAAGVAALVYTGRGRK